MLLTVLAGLVMAIALVPFGNFFKKNRSVLLAVIPAMLFMFYLQYIPQVSAGNVIFESTQWVPALGVNFSFRLDGLSLLFALIITGIGTLVFIYSAAYLKNHIYINRFFGYLLLFMASMLGMVLSNNVILLFIFWELTTITSFFLIGFNNENDDSRRSALMALTVTGLGGLFLLIGLVIAGQIVGSYSIGDMIANADAIKSSPSYILILICFLLGTFTKSAQFPFHFWLPSAMKAPTPVSAYLHSATMVKAGIFLMARFTPILGGTILWQVTLMSFGGVTMLFAAYTALFKKDLKGILAYSTVSVLGVLTFLLGMGTENAITAFVIFILVHALYKAALFLVTGIIDHQTGTRDLTRLSGLRKVLLPVALAGALAALSSAGFPLTFGFIGKDLIYEATLDFGSNWEWILTALAVLTKIGLLAAGFLVGFRPFLGKLKPDFEQVKMPSVLMWAPPLILGLLGLILGIFPHLAGDFISEAAVKGVMQNYVPVELKRWHGFNLVLLLSVITLTLGTLLYFFNKPKGTEKLYWFSSERYFVSFFLFSKKIALAFTNYFHDGYLRSYLIKIIIFAELLLIFDIYRGGLPTIDFSVLSPINFYDIAVVIFLIGGLYKTLKTTSRLTAVVSTSIIGYAICLIFVIYSAPDLAMTQFTIDTLTVVLFVLVLYKLPPFLKYRNTKILIRDSTVSIIFGVLLSIISLRVLQEPTENTVSDFYAKYAYTLGKGKNVVNVILVDFRGMDTMFEIVVLSIAAVGVYSLLKLRLKSSEKE